MFIRGINANRMRDTHYYVYGQYKDVEGVYRQRLLACLGRHKKIEDAYAHAFTDYLRAAERLSKIEHAMQHMQEKRA